jgi:small-conductance mechanosensitive channel
MPIENKGHEESRPRWLVPVLVAGTILIIMAVGAYFLYGRELFQRPLLAVAVVIAWLGALVGISIGGDTGKF